MKRIVKKRIIGLIVLMGIVVGLSVYDLVTALIFVAGLLFMLIYLDWMEMFKEQ